MKPYIPSFVCPHCKQARAAKLVGNSGQFLVCDCSESRDDWERKHRIEMERRKNLKRRGNR